VSIRTYHALEIQIIFPSHSTKLNTQITDSQNAVYEVFLVDALFIHISLIVTLITKNNRFKTTAYKHTRRTAWAPKLFMAKGLTRYCWLVRGPHVEKQLVDYLTA
jgi:hypothetical protein